MIPQHLIDLAGGCSPKQEITLSARDAATLGFEAVDGIATVTGKQLADAIKRGGQPAEEVTDDAPAEDTPADPAPGGNKSKKKTAAKPEKQPDTPSAE